MRKTAGFMQIYAIGGIAILALTAALYWQIGKTATERAAKDEVISVNKSQAATIGRLQAESQLNEIIVVDNAVKKEVITQEVIKYRDRVREIIRQAPENDCIGQPHDPAITSLLNSSGEN
jgi:hypothetical protein